MNNKKINIRYQITHYQPIYTGAGKSLEKLIKEIDKEQFKVEVLTAYKKGLPRKEYKDGYTIIRVGQGFFGKSKELSLIGKMDFAIKSFLYNLFNNNYEIIKFIGVGNVSFLSILISKILRKSIINKITAVGDDDPKKLSKGFIGKTIIKLLQGDNVAHWVISQEIYDLCKKYTSWRNVYLIPNPVNILFQKYEEIEKERLKRINGLNFLFVGGVIKRKGIDVLIDLWEKYEIQYDLLICGPIGNESDILNKINNCKNKHLKFLGNLNREEVNELYLSSKCFLFPSTREGLPNVILEAMSSGLPIVAYNIPGVTDFLLGEKAERGICAHTTNIEEWRNIIEKVINEEINLREKTKEAFEWVKNNASTNVVVKKWEDIYKNMLYGKGK